MSIMEVNKIYNVDCLDGMKELEDNSVDLIVTDPPYGYSFMGKEWDKAVPSVDIWKEALRVLKPGAFAFVMCAPRQDVSILQMSTMQQVGFRLDFSPIYWAYAEGFPKAGNISKMVDKRLGAEREVVGINPNGFAPTNSGDICNEGGAKIAHPPLTISSSDEAKALDGSYAGFQPKPAVEVILIAMKPLSQKTYVDQALSNEKGVTWLDNCRMPYENEDEMWRSNLQISSNNSNEGWKREAHKKPIERESNQQGRFPANLLVSDDVLNDGKITISKDTLRDNKIKEGTSFYKESGFNPIQTIGFNDSGSFSRYFNVDKWFKEALKRLPKDVLKTYPFLIVPKASKSEKNKGCEEIEAESHSKKHYATERLNDLRMKNEQRRLPNRNNHPTVKPIKLMSYLITLGSRQGDIILDPFIGSGTTAIAARILSRKFIGFEKEKEYHKIAEARIKPFISQTKLGEGEFEQTANCMSEM